jgi:hypothetical protein
MCPANARGSVPATDRPLEQIRLGRRDAVAAALTALAVFMVGCLYFPNESLADAALVKLARDEADLAPSWSQYALPLLGTIHGPAFHPYVATLKLVARVPTDADRMILPAALFVALASGVLVLVLRQLGCRLAVAVSVGLAYGLGFAGRVSSPILGETSLVHATALLAITYALVAAHRAPVATRQTRWIAGVLLLGVAISSQILAVTALPAMLATFSRSSGASSTVRRLLLIVAAVACGVYVAGVLYLLQSTPAVVWSDWIPSGGRWAAAVHDMGPLSEAWMKQSRAVVVTLSNALRLSGTVLAILGCVLLAFRGWAWPIGLVIAGAGLGAAFAPIPLVREHLAGVIAVAWIPAGVAVDWLIAKAGGGATLGALLVPALVLPQWLAPERTSSLGPLVRKQYAIDAFVAGLASPSAIVSEDVWHDRQLLASLGRKGRGDVVRAPADPNAVLRASRAGYTVFAFDRARDLLAAEGLRFNAHPVRETFLPALRGAPRGSIVALAAGAGFADSVVHKERAPFASFGATASLFGRSHWAYAAVGVSGRTGGALEEPHIHQAMLRIDRGMPIGSTGVRASRSLELRVSGASAEIVLDGTGLARTRDGAVAVVLTPAGQVVRTLTAPRQTGLRATIPASAFPVFRLEGTSPCTALESDRLVDITTLVHDGAIAGRVESSGTEPTEVALTLTRDRVLAIQMETRPSTRQLEFESRSDASARPDGREIEHEVQAAFRRAHTPTRFLMRFGGVPRAATARVVRPRSERVILCADAPRAEWFLAEDSDARLDLADSRNGVFGSGWHQVEGQGAQTFRWTAAPLADLHISLREPADVTVVVRAMPAIDAARSVSAIHLRVNEWTTDSRELRPGWHSYEWTIPAARWHAGVNEVSVGVPAVVQPSSSDAARRDARPFGVAVEHIGLARAGDLAAVERARW